MRKESSVLLKDSTGRHQPCQQNSTLPLQNQGTAGRGGLRSSLCLEKDQGQVDTHQISGAPTLQAPLQGPKGQSNQIQFQEPKRQAACSVAGSRASGLEGPANFTGCWGRLTPTQPALAQDRPMPDS